MWRMARPNQALHLRLRGIHQAEEGHRRLRAAAREEVDLRLSCRAMKLASFDALVSALQQAGVRYLIAGGLAVNAHGYLRFTKDVDVVVQLVPDNIARALAKSLGRIEGRFVTIPTLIRMKQAADRPQDRIDIEYLRKRLEDGGAN